MNPSTQQYVTHYQVGSQHGLEEAAQCSKEQMPQQQIQQQIFSNHKGPMKVCLKRPDGSMVEQTHLSVSHTKDGKFVINSNGHPHGGQWIQGNGQAIRAILIDNKQGGIPTSVQLPPGTRIVSPSSVRHISPAAVQRVSQPQIRHSASPAGAPVQRISAAPAQRIASKTGSQISHSGQRSAITRKMPAQSTTTKVGKQNCMPPSVRPVIQQHYNQQQIIHPPPAPGPRPSYSASQPSHLHAAVEQQEPSIDYKQHRSVPQYKTPHTPSTPLNHSASSTRQPTSSTSARWSNNSVLNGISTMSNGASGSRKRVSPVQFDVKPTPTTTDRKRPRRSSERGGKGLRHFSSKVCEKVKSKGVTTYLEVSEELVEEFSQQSIVHSTPSSANSFDVKNIRRRVYDALNVLCAMNIISKDKKEIRWIGLPTNSLQECRQLEKYKQEIQQKIKEKKKKAQEFMLQLIAYRTLIQRNRDMEEKTGPLPENATIQVPFIILSTGPNTQIGLEVADDKTEYEFTFNEIFEIHDEIGILKKMGFCYGIDSGEFTPEGLAKAESLLPKSAKPFLKELFPRKSEMEEDQKPLEIVEHPQQISVKHEPQELTEVKKLALETYSFDAPTYSSGYPSYNGQHSNSTSSAISSEQSHSARPIPSTSSALVQQHNAADKSRDTAAANTLLSLTAVNQ